MAVNASSNQANKWSAQIKERSRELGFSFCGISAADFLEAEAPRLEAWLTAERHGAMGYMANWFDKRLDPRKLVPGARSVISLLFNYHNPEPATSADAPRISQYAYGKDYHYVLKRKLKDLLAYAATLAGTEVNGRVFVDSAPVLERAWAARSGLGWVGKNTNLINPRAGSYFFLAEVILDMELEPDGPMRDYCGSCTACIDACPTDAITPYSVDGSRCISYFTIELRESALPSEFSGRFSDWMFGCDICQEVCPWNRFSSRHSEPAFDPPAELASLSRSDWEELTEEVFKELFRGSPVKRTGFAGLKRNIKFLKPESEGPLKEN